MSKLLACLLFLISFQCAALEPSPALSPVDVVTFQLKSLQENTGGDGIAATFRFASPANKKMTGPLQRFSQLFDIPQYRPMINHQGASIELESANETAAEVVAEIVDENGSIHQYRFRLSLQSDGEFTNCWMTDAVIWDPRPGRSA